MVSMTKPTAAEIDATLATLSAYEMTRLALRCDLKRPGVLTAEQRKAAVGVVIGTELLNRASATIWLDHSGGGTIGSNGIRRAFDEVLGEGAFEALAGDVYDALRAKAVAA